jgi:hypothetical protein
MPERATPGGIMKKYSVALPLLAAALFVLGGGTRAYGDSVTVFNDQATSGAGLQGWTGNLASLFIVNQTTTVGALGIFNPTGSGLVTGTNNIEVGLYDVTTGQQIGSTVTFQAGNSYTVGGEFDYDIFQSFSATLAPGLYEVDAVGFNSAYSNGNTGLGSPGPVFDGGGYLTFAGYSYYDSNTLLDFPNVNNSGNKDTHIYDAATLAIVTPEPGSLFLLGTGLLGLAAILFWKAKSSGLVLRP